MQATDFRSPSAGRIHRSFDGIDTFVPAALPPTLVYDEQLVLVLSRADTSLSELSGIGRQLPNPHLLINSYLRREAVLSSRIEGTRTSLSELLLEDVEELGTTGSSEADRREVRNYVAALEQGIERLRQGRPITLNLVRELHETLMRGVRGDLASPGRFRSVQNWIGPRGVNVEDAAYVPPPPELLMECLSDWERFVNTKDTIPDLIQCALMHEQFEAIHPFIDGNGRIGRVLITLFLLDRERLSQPLLNLSAYIEAHQLDYYDLLQRVRTDGDWGSWLRFFLEGVEQTSREALRLTTALVDLREAFRERLMSKPRALALVDHLFVNPYLTVKRADSILQMSNPTARGAVATLQEMGVISPVTDRSWRRIYVCRPILDVILAGEVASDQ